MTAEWLDALKTQSPAQLRELGMVPWNDPADPAEPEIIRGKVLWLFPGDWYGDLPAGYEVVTITGEARPFHILGISDDTRGGMLAFGILVDPWKGSN